MAAIIIKCNSWFVTSPPRCTGDRGRYLSPEVLPESGEVGVRFKIKWATSFSDGFVDQLIAIMAGDGMFHLPLPGATATGLPIDQVTREDK